MNTESQLARAGLFDARVPRYTSYPTAPHFSTAVNGGDFSQWLSAIPSDGRVSLYVHIPYCRRLCWFCACRTQGTKSDDPVRAYVESLRHEIALVSARVAPGVRLSRLHWGGGTPTLLQPDGIALLARSIFEAFPMAPDAEFSVEIDPNEIDEPRLDALVAAGMNRASIGVQDFDPVIQKIIGRDQSYDITERTARLIRDRGVRSLNADILYGLPRQTAERMTASIDQLIQLSPDRVALYGYAHVPWMARRQQMIPAQTLPSPVERFDLFQVARDRLVAAEYAEIGIDHFAKSDDGLARAMHEGRLRRNFQGYTDDTAPVLIGLGASAISRFPQGYSQNAPATSEHLRAIRSGTFSVTRGHRFSGEDHARGRMIEALMCDFRIDAQEIRSRFGVSTTWLGTLFDNAAQLFGTLVEIDEVGLRIPPHSRPLTRMIARCFDAYELSKTGHSPAI